MVRSGVERSSLRAFMQTHVKRIQLDDGGDRPNLSARDGRIPGFASTRQEMRNHGTPPRVRRRLTGR